MDFLPHLSESVQQTLPIFILLLTGLTLMLMDAFKVRTALPWVTALGLGLACIVAYAIRIPESNIVFVDMLETGGPAPLILIFLCLSALLTLFFIADYLERLEKPIYDVYALLIFAVIGMILLANANNLIMTFIGLETMSICLYIFAAMFKMDPKSNESGLKYFLLGSFASAFLLFGISLLYGLTGHLDFGGIAANSASFTEYPLIFFSAVGLILIGFLFKVAAFPFHSWTPDVYEGTPTPLAGFMATGSKMAAFVGLGMIIVKLNLVAYDKVFILLAFCAMLTMIYGNIVAARQTNFKRMLAYSSIAHTGYVLLGICAGAFGFSEVIFYMFIYTLMNIGAFGMVGMAERDYPDTNLDNWKGLGMRSPYFAGLMSIFLFSLAGIPPMAGFMAKYYIFISAIRSELIIPAIVGILTSVVGAYYYIRVIVLMYFGTNEEPQLNTNFSPIPTIGIALLALLVLILGIFPSLVRNPLEASQVVELIGQMAK